MENSCLYPFYEYIIQQWLPCGSDFPEYDEVFSMQKVSSGEKWVELEQRKKEIWEATRDVLRIDSLDAQRQKITESKKKETVCKLCMVCEKCEKFYWEQLELVLSRHKRKPDDVRCEFQIPKEINGLLEQKDKPVDIYLDHYAKRNVHEMNYLLMLKGFSSSTPILLNYAKNTNFYSGGGFYLRWNGIGIAVDPGYLFVQNLHDFGLTVLDIDVVIVTHEHIDHSSDVRLLDDLHYNVASKNKENEVFWDKADFAILKRKVSGHKIRWYMDSVTYREATLLQEKESGFNPDYNELYCVAIVDDVKNEMESYHKDETQLVDSNSIMISENITVKFFTTSHEQYDKDGTKLYFKHTFGCVFECMDRFITKRSIGYTSDTSIQDATYKGMFSLLKDCQVVISNISGIYKTDVLLQKGKDRHLGYYGCFKLVNDLLKGEECKLQYFLLSEFSNQVSDIRYNVAQYMQKEVNDLEAFYSKHHKIRVIPTEIGLTLDLSALRIKCSCCKTYSDKTYILKPFGENRSLQYICPECIYSNEG